MPAALTAAQIAIALLPTIETGVAELVAFINKIRGNLQQTGEWPDATDAAYRAALLAKGIDPAYQQDPK